MFYLQISFLIFCDLLLIVAGIGLLYKGWTERQLRRYVEDTPTSTPKSVALGLAEVMGTATKASETLTDPIEDRPSLLYKYALYEYGRDSDEDKPSWSTITTGTLGVPFLLEGEEGQVFVSPTDADIRTSGKLNSPSSHPDQLPLNGVAWSRSEGPPESLEKYLSDSQERLKYRVDSSREADAKMEWTLLDRVDRETEDRFGFATERVEPGDDLYLLGEAKSPDADSVPDDVTAVFEAPESASSSFARGSGSFPLIISTKGEHGLLKDTKEKEWRAFAFGAIFLIPAVGFPLNFLIQKFLL